MLTLILDFSIFIGRYINVRESKDARLAFEALRLLASLFCHKKFTLEWISRGGLNLLMHLPR